MATTDVNGVVLGDAPTGVPHLKIPFAIGSDGSAATVKQDSEEEIVQSVAMLVGTRTGTRLMVPTYGIPDPTFGGLSPVTVQVAAGRWEKRARVSVAATPGNTEQVLVEVATT